MSFKSCVRDNDLVDFFSPSFLQYVIILCVDMSNGRVSISPYSPLHTHIILSQPKERTANPNSNITFGLGRARFLSPFILSVCAGVTSQIKTSDLIIFVKIAFGILGAPILPLESSRSTMSIFISLNAALILSLIYSRLENPPI